MYLGKYVSLWDRCYQLNSSGKRFPKKKYYVLIFNTNYLTCIPHLSKRVQKVEYFLGLLQVVELVKQKEDSSTWFFVGRPDTSHSFVEHFIGVWATTESVRNTSPTLFFGFFINFIFWFSIWSFSLRCKLLCLFRSMRVRMCFSNKIVFWGGTTHFVENHRMFNYKTLQLRNKVNTVNILCSIIFQ